VFADRDPLGRKVGIPLKCAILSDPALYCCQLTVHSIRLAGGRTHRGNGFHSIVASWVTKSRSRLPLPPGAARKDCCKHEAVIGRRNKRLFRFVIAPRARRVRRQAADPSGSAARRFEMIDTDGDRGLRAVAS
jgi:hypothetical protein